MKPLTKKEILKRVAEKEQEKISENCLKKATKQKPFDKKK